ncbi:hypothetical protein AX760_04575 [Pararhizobium antarcticum]|uniref:Response regulatory domain-containing protein n=1 Tax=Pararhizobium antarcticum TaxID=1798805 RepID=A0A657LS44_9HYPH|nr:hypothetical protein AX761_20775 [Rhizobium sp. 58]OJF95101.1 hypothetical protein AX760_04575 [Pararhizobium antarcticum]
MRRAFLVCEQRNIELQPSKTIVAIATDDALLHSLAFALGVEGYSTRSFNAWQSASELMATAVCVIVDVDICRNDAAARQALMAAGSRIILLSDGMAQPAVSPSVCIVTKPLDGKDILAAVEHFRPATTQEPVVVQPNFTDGLAHP